MTSRAVARRRAGAALLLMAFLVLPSLVPTGGAHYVDAVPRGPRATQNPECLALGSALANMTRDPGHRVDVPCTGSSALDAGLATGVALVDQLLAEIDRQVQDANASAERDSHARLSGCPDADTRIDNQVSASGATGSGGIAATTPPCSLVFRDRFDAGGRVGGETDWSHGILNGTNAQGDAWAPTSSGEVGHGTIMRWQDPVTGKYPLGAAAYLASPLIDLSAVVGAHAAADEADERRATLIDDLREVVAAAENLTGTSMTALVGVVNTLDTLLRYKISILRAGSPVVLAFDHRYNFKEGTDGGRLYVYTEEPTPAVVGNASKGALLCDRTAVPSTGLVTPTLGRGATPPVLVDVLGIKVSSTRSFCYDGPATAWKTSAASEFVVAEIGVQSSSGDDQRTFLQTRVTDPGRAYTGASGDRSDGAWERVEFDVAPFAGKKVWIVWRVATTDPVSALRPAYFDSGFPAGGFKGWHIDNVLVAADLHPHNVKILSVEEPSTRRPEIDPARVFVPEGVPTPVTVRLHNRGTYNESVRLDVGVARLDETLDEAHVVPVFNHTENVTVTQGHIVELGTMWTVPQGRADYRLEIRALLPGDRQEQNRTLPANASESTVVVKDTVPEDNEVILNLTATNIEHVAATVRLEPTVADKGVERLLTSTIVNDGNVPATATVRVRILNETGGDVTTEVLAGDASLTFPLAAGAVRNDLAWRVLPRKDGIPVAGIFRVVHEVTTTGGASDTDVIGLFSRRIVPTLFYDNHDDDLATPGGFGFDPALSGSWTTAPAVGPVAGDGWLWRIDRTVGLLAVELAGGELSDLVSGGNRWENVDLNFTHAIRQVLPHDHGDFRDEALEVRLVVGPDPTLDVDRNAVTLARFHLNPSDQQFFSEKELARQEMRAESVRLDGKVLALDDVGVPVVDLMRRLQGVGNLWLVFRTSVPHDEGAKGLDATTYRLFDIPNCGGTSTCRRVTAQWLLDDIRLSTDIVNSTGTRYRKTLVYTSGANDATEQPAAGACSETLPSVVGSGGWCPFEAPLGFSGTGTSDLSILDLDFTDPRKRDMKTWSRVQVQNDTVVTEGRTARELETNLWHLREDVRYEASGGRTWYSGNASKARGGLDNLTDYRLVSPAIVLGIAEKPIVRLIHKYRLPDAAKTVAVVEVQYCRHATLEACQDPSAWSPFHRIQPVGGYPEPGVVQSFSQRLGFAGVSRNATLVDGALSNAWEGDRFDLTQAIRDPITGEDVSLAGRIVRLGFRQITLTLTPGLGTLRDFEGWWIADVQVDSTDAPANDLAIATLPGIVFDQPPVTDPVDGVDRLILAPGTEVTVGFNVTNRGRFAQQGFEATLTILSDPDTRPLLLVEGLRSASSVSSRGFPVATFPEEDLGGSFRDALGLLAAKGVVVTTSTGGDPGVPADVDRVVLPVPATVVARASQSDMTNVSGLPDAEAFLRVDGLRGTSPSIRVFDLPLTTLRDPAVLDANASTQLDVLWRVGVRSLERDGIYLRTDAGVASDRPESTSILSLPDLLPVGPPFVADVAQPLGPGTNSTVSFAWTVPSVDDQRYRFAARVIPTEVGVEDENTVNDVLSYPTAVPVRSVVDVALDMEVAPLSADIATPRVILLSVRNLGNIPVDAVTLERVIEPLRGAKLGASEHRTLSLAGLVGDLADRSSNRLNPGGKVVPVALLGAGIPGKESDLANITAPWLPPAARDFVVLGRIAVPGDWRASNDVQVELVEAFQTFFSDGIDEGERLFPVEYVAGAYDNTTGQANEWHISDEAGFIVPERPADRSGFWAGDEARGTYADQMNASLILPSVDLSSAATATLSLFQYLSLEDAFDATAVEVSLDGGASWRQLEPLRRAALEQAGVIQELATANPLVPGHDPDASREAFSGDHGWVPLEFDLQQLTELTERVLLVALPTDAFVDGRAPLRDVGGFSGGNDTRNFSDESWIFPRYREAPPANVPARFSPAYWFAENLTQGLPLPRSGSRTFWSGACTPLAARCTASNAVNTSLTISLDATGIDVLARRIAVGFWDHRAGVDPVFNREGSGGWYSVSVGAWNGAQRNVTYCPEDVSDGVHKGRPCRVVSYPRAFRDGWMYRELEIYPDRGAVQGADLGRVEAIFEYRSHGPPGSATQPPDVAPYGGGSTGWSIDDLSAYLFTPRGGARKNVAYLFPTRCDVTDAVPTIGVRCVENLEAMRTSGAAVDGPAGTPTMTIASNLAGGPVRSDRAWTVTSAPFNLTEGGAAVSWTGQWYLDKVCRAPSCAPGQESRVWRFADNSTGTPREVGSADARLVTPVIDLSRAGGSFASLDFESHFDLTPFVRSSDPFSAGAVEVQVYDPLTQTFGPWQQLFTPWRVPDHRTAFQAGPCGGVSVPAAGQDCRGYGWMVPQDLDVASNLLAPASTGKIVSSTRQSHAGAPFERVDNGAGAPCYARLEANYTFTYLASAQSQSPQSGPCKLSSVADERSVSFVFSGTTAEPWVPARFDLSPYIGKVVRVGFHGWSSPFTPARTVPNGLVGWLVGNLTVTAEVFNGLPMQFRVPMATDASNNEGGVGLDNLDVVGTQYQNNVGLFLTRVGGERPTSRDFSLVRSPGENVTFAGEVRNLGLQARDLVSLEVDLSSVSSKLPAVDGVVPQTGRVTLIDRAHLSAAGTPGDRRAFLVDLTLPQTTTPTAVDQVVGRLYLTERLKPLLESEKEEVLGNVQAKVTIDVLRSRDVRIDSFSVTPRVVEGLAPNGSAAEAVSLRAVLRNAGTESVTADVFLNVSRAQDRSPAVPVTSRNVTLAPRTSEIVAMSFLAPSNGTYNLTFDLAYGTPLRSCWDRGQRNFGQTGGVGRCHDHIMVGRDLVVRDFSGDTGEESFEQAAVGGRAGDVNWTTAVTPEGEAYYARSGSSPSPLAGDGRHAFHATDSDAHTGDRSLLGGIEPEDFLQGGSYPHHADWYAATPCLDLRDFPSTMTPFLSFWHKPRFASGDGGVVEIRILDPAADAATRCDDLAPWLYKGSGTDSDASPSVVKPFGFPGGWISIDPAGGYPDVVRFVNGAADDPNSPEDESAQADRNPLGPGRGVFGGFEEEWAPASFDLYAQAFPLLTVSLDAAGLRAGDPLPVAGHVVQLRWRIGTRESTTDPVDEPGQGWLIDDVVLAGYHPTAAARTTDEAGNLRVHQVRDNNLKQFHVKITNGGTVEDTFDVTIDRVVGGIPFQVGVTVGPDDTPALRLTLPPGGTSVVPVNVHIPIDPALSNGLFQVPVRVASTKVPGHAAILNLPLELTTREWADLDTVLQLPGTSLPEGIPTVLTAIVTNAGIDASKATAVRFLAEPQGGTSYVINETALPALAPGSDATVSVPFLPPLGRLGPHTLKAVADPDGVVAEILETNNVGQAVVEITRLRRPDLVVPASDLRVLDTAGAPVTEVEEGEVVRIIAIVENRGFKEARDVGVRVLVGSQVIKDDTISLLGVGEKRAVSANWIAAPGNFSIQVQAQTPPTDLELTSDNNAAATRLLARNFNLRLTADAVARTVSAGDLVLYRVKVENLARFAERLAFTFEVAHGFSAEAVPSEIEIPPAGSETILVKVRAPEGVPAGFYATTVRAGSLLLAGRATALALETTLSERGELDAVVGDVETEPGEGELGLTILNAGNFDETVTIVATDRPRGWSVDETSAVVPAFGSARVRVPFETPTDARPGTYEVSLLVRGKDAAAEEAAVVTLVPLSRVEITPSTSRDVEPGREYERDLDLKSVGNVASTVFLTISGAPDGWRASLSRTELTLPPGATETVTVRVLAPGDVPEGSIPFRVEAVHADTNRVDAAAFEVGIFKPDLVLGDVTRSPRFLANPGDVVNVAVGLTNAGRAAARNVQVALFVDESLVDLGDVDVIEPGATTSVDLAWVARADVHAAAIAIDPFDTVAEVDEENNARTFGLAVEGEPGLGGLVPGGADLPAPGAALFLVVAAIAAALLGRPGRGRQT